MGCSFANTEWHSHCIYDLQQNSYKECTYIYIYIYINTELLDGNQGHQLSSHQNQHSVSPNICLTGEGMFKLQYKKLPQKVLSPCFKISWVKSVAIEKHQILGKFIANQWLTSGVKLIYDMSWMVENVVTEQTDPYHTNSQNVMRCVQWECSQTSSDSIYEKCWGSWQNTALTQWNGKEKSWV